MTPVALPPHQRVKLSPLRRRSGEHMAMSAAAIPHASITVEVDYGGVETAIAAHGDSWRARHGRSLGRLPFLLRALVTTLQAFPEANSMLDDRELIVFDAIHLGIAVDVPGRGLIVPVLRDAQRATIPELALGVTDLATRARSKRLHPDDVVGATYTVTNVGPFGVHDASPIVNHPQVAILAMNAVTRRPVVIADPDEHIDIRSIGLLTQAFDHRAFDGAYCASLLAHLALTLGTTDWVAAFDEPSDLSTSDPIAPDPEDDA
jgi:pyruvate/2-oxoglutarate dehydrogenase complex dihydrolipoamide acyltransferase (E2) component